MQTETNAPRNLTLERQIAFLERQKREAMAPISAIETVVVAVAKRDKGGNVVLDGDGVPVVVIVVCPAGGAPRMISFK